MKLKLNVNTLMYLEVGLNFDKTNYSLYQCVLSAWKRAVLNPFSFATINVTQEEAQILGIILDKRTRQAYSFSESNETSTALVNFVTACKKYNFNIIFDKSEVV